ncbi:hypothetical protein BP5796_10984 [Coleophoma crateriformis]|uniref:Uncharacterized protein n=1 Tax=Coleophoma crateriformis TaxID=565419 RepID=A0A3D8QLK5_9HELO|nr:hypothetical protein BP5796_10984 [Coleophoma crateriformis]
MCRTEFTKYGKCGHTVTEAFYCIEQLNAREAPKGKGKGKITAPLGGGHCVKKDLPCEDSGLCPSCLAKQEEKESEDLEEDVEQHKSLPTGSIRGRAKTIVTNIKEAVGEKKRKVSNSAKKSDKDGSTTPSSGVPRPVISKPALQHSTTVGSSPVTPDQVPPVQSHRPPAIPTARFANSRDEHQPSARAKKNPITFQKSGYFSPYLSNLAKPRTPNGQAHSSAYSKPTTPYGQPILGAPTKVGMFQHSFFSLRPETPHGNPTMAAAPQYESHQLGFGGAGPPHGNINMSQPSSYFQPQSAGVGRAGNPHGDFNMSQPSAYFPPQPTSFGKPGTPRGNFNMSQPSAYFPPQPTSFGKPGTPHGNFNMSQPSTYFPPQPTSFGQPGASHGNFNMSGPSTYFPPQPANFGQTGAPHGNINMSGPSSYFQSQPASFGQPGAPHGNINMSGPSSYFQSQPASSSRSRTPYGTSQPSDFGRPQTPYGQSTSSAAAMGAGTMYGDSPTSTYGQYPHSRTQSSLPNDARMAGRTGAPDPVELAQGYCDIIGAHPRQLPTHLREEDPADSPMAAPQGSTDIGGGMMVDNEVLRIHAELKRRMAADRDKEMETRVMENQF